jgi:hypothetical protein
MSRYEFGDLGLLLWRLTSGLLGWGEQYDQLCDQHPAIAVGVAEYRHVLARLERVQRALLSLASPDLCLVAQLDGVRAVGCCQQQRSPEVFLDAAHYVWRAVAVHWRLLPRRAWVILGRLNWASGVWPAQRQAVSRKSMLAHVDAQGEGGDEEHHHDNGCA